VARVLSPRVAHIFYIYFGVFFTIGDRTCAPLPELLSLAGRPKPPFLNDAMAGSCHRSSGSPTWGMPTPEEVISVIYFGRYRRLQIHGGHLPARGAAGAVDHVIFYLFKSFLAEQAESTTPQTARSPNWNTGSRPVPH